MYSTCSVRSSSPTTKSMPSPSSQRASSSISSGSRLDRVRGPPGSIQHAPVAVQRTRVAPPGRFGASTAGNGGRRAPVNPGWWTPAPSPQRTPLRSAADSGPSQSNRRHGHLTQLHAAPVSAGKREPSTLLFPGRLSAPRQVVLPIVPATNPPGPAGSSIRRRLLHAGQQLVWLNTKLGDGACK